MPAGLVPLNTYTGDLFERDFLTGDWGGSRTELAKKGIQFEVDFTQYMQAVTDGGKDRGGRYGGALDYLMNVDFHRMGVIPGGFLTLRAETRYGDGANDISGALIPVNTEGYFPLTRNTDDDIPITLTTLRYTQFLGEKVGFIVGKFDTLDSTNEFAGGRGVSQFMNGNFVFPTTGALTVPYSTLGTGIVLLPIENLMITSVIMNTNDSSTTTGFGDIGDGFTWVTAAQYQYQLFKLPGGQGVAVGYAADNEFKKVAGGFVFDRGVGLSPVTDDESWFVTWDFWQYLWTAEPVTKPIDVSNGKQDVRGIGFFSRLTFADSDTNPVRYTFAAGFGATGLIPTRERDSFGIGYSYTSIQETRLTGLLNVADNSEAFEFYYNVAITPATHLTFDVQMIEAASKSFDTAVVLGMRLNLKF